MRVVLTSLPIYSHVVPALIPLAKALRRHGHEVAVATGDAMADELRQAGIRWLRLPGVINHAELSADRELIERLKLVPHPASLIGKRPLSREEDDHAFREVFVGVLAERFADGVVTQARAWGVDLVVSESLEFGGCLAAEKLGVPHAVLDTAPLMRIHHPELPEWLDILREKVGLGPAGDLTRHGGRLRAGLLPELWYPEQLREPACRHYRPDEEADDKSRIDQWLADLPGDQPLVLMTLGTGAPDNMPKDAPLFEILVEALGAVRCVAIVALGRYRDPSQWSGPRPDNVHLVRFVPQRKLLTTCSAFVTHAGFSGVREALLGGVPMLTIPLFGEQAENSARVAELGLGMALNLANLDAASVADAVSALLEHPVYRNAALSMRRKILGLPGFDQLVADLAALTEHA
ncbi:MAG TPA: glycosyltransferase [Streptosporangiaceae bacterium]|nr:glycosyltransferase [Streptosporangiaceae bacterium]